MEIDEVDGQGVTQTDQKDATTHNKAPTVTRKETRAPAPGRGHLSLLMLLIPILDELSSIRSSDLRIRIRRSSHFGPVSSKGRSGGGGVSIQLVLPSFFSIEAQSVSQKWRMLLLEKVEITRPELIKSPPTSFNRLISLITFLRGVFFFLFYY